MYAHITPSVILVDMTCCLRGTRPNWPQTFSLFSSSLLPHFCDDVIIEKCSRGSKLHFKSDGFVLWPLFYYCFSIVAVLSFLARDRWLA